MLFKHFVEFLLTGLFKALSGTCSVNLCLLVWSPGSCRLSSCRVNLVPTAEICVIALSSLDLSVTIRLGCEMSHCSLSVTQRLFLSALSCSWHLPLRTVLFLSPLTSGICFNCIRCCWISRRAYTHLNSSVFCDLYSITLPWWWLPVLRSSLIWMVSSG